MGHGPAGVKPVSLIDQGFQDLSSFQQALHDIISFSQANQVYGSLAAFFPVSGGYDPIAFRILSHSSDQLANPCFIANQDRNHQAQILCLKNRFQDMVIASPGHGDPTFSGIS
jgi:hypothetical protein